MSNKSGTKTEVPRVDNAPHGVEIPIPGTLMLAGVREAGGSLALGASRFSKIINHTSYLCDRPTVVAVVTYFTAVGTLSNL